MCWPSIKLKSVKTPQASSTHNVRVLVRVLLHSEPHAAPRLVHFERRRPSLYPSTLEFVPEDWALINNSWKLLSSWSSRSQSASIYTLFFPLRKGLHATLVEGVGLYTCPRSLPLILNDGHCRGRTILGGGKMDEFTGHVNFFIRITRDRNGQTSEKDFDPSKIVRLWQWGLY